MDDAIDSDKSLDILLQNINENLGPKEDEIETIDNNLNEALPSLFDQSDLMFDFVENYIPQKLPDDPPITDNYNTKWMEVIWPILKTSRPSKDYPVLLEIVPKLKKRSYKFYWSDGRIRSGYISYKRHVKDEWHVTINCDHFKDCLKSTNS